MSTINSRLGRRKGASEAGGRRRCVAFGRYLITLLFENAKPRQNSRMVLSMQNAYEKAHLIRGSLDLRKQKCLEFMQIHYDMNGIYYRRRTLCRR